MTRTINSKFFLVVVIIFVFTFNSFAQDRTVQGFVTVFDSLPLIGANITVKSTKQVVFTDSVGSFSVLCSPEDIIVVKARGFSNQKVKLTSNIKFAAVNMKMKPGEKNREYAIGYGSTTDRDKMSAVANLNNKDVDFSNYSNMYELIQGRFAGVQVANGEIIIRGISTINGSNSAMIIIDGMQVESQALRSLPPNQVESIDILKDGTTAIYGARGALGVVIIKTKTAN
jgi:TonB-dependent SusC/RagA subfamily outer membrane receptor